MTKYSQAAGVALGWTTVAVAGLVEPIVGRGRHMDLYHWGGRPANLFGPVLLAFALIWVALTLLLSSALKPGRWRVAVWGAMLVLLPWRLLDAAGDVAHVPGWLTLPSSAFALAALALLVIFWRRLWERPFERVMDVASNVLQLLAFVGAFCLVTLVWMWWSARDLNDPRPLHAESESTAQRPAHPRIICIVFDELSQQQVFDQRFPGLELPAFDDLASTSTMLTRVHPAGFKTEQVLPSLFSGKPIADVEATVTGQLLIKPQSGDRWRRFHAEDSVFQDALSRGYSTTIDGWYNPYCRIMPSVLDHCLWFYNVSVESGMTTEGSFRSNFLEAVNDVARSEALEKLLNRVDEVDPPKLPRRDLQRLDYERLHSAAEADLKNADRSFLLVHMPVPHPYGMFNRHTGKFVRSHATYIDNLALANRCMAEFRAVLQDSGQWDSSVVLVMGDHSWRTNNMWRLQKTNWTSEEEAASHGGEFDERPVYMVKMPGQNTGQRIDAPYAALRTRQLLDGVMRGQVTDAAQFAAWVQAGGSGVR